MRRVDRDPRKIPQALTGPDSPAAKERRQAEAKIRAAQAAMKARKKRPKAFDFKVYARDEVKLALELLFHGKCAYCESFYANQSPVDVEHYRPKGMVEGEKDHWGYWWLAADWDNLLPSCIDCNRRRKQKLPNPKTGSLADLETLTGPRVLVGKKDAFPVIDGTRVFEPGPVPGQEIHNEQPYLLDPCRDDPGAHLSFAVDRPDPFGLALPKALDPAFDPAKSLHTTGATTAPKSLPPQVSDRGLMSIHVYGLNRLGLIQARTRVLRQLEALRLMIEDADRIARILDEVDDPKAHEAIPVIDQLIGRLTREIQRLGASDQPYSAMVRQWTDYWSHTLARQED